MSEEPTRNILVWDLPTRLFHWSLVLAVAGLWWTGEKGLIETHALIGYVTLALLLFRILWGLFGSETARFASFVRGPAAGVEHARHLLARGPLSHSAGHNPLGGWSVVLLLLVLVILSVGGLFLYDDEIFWAPLNAFVGEETEAMLGRLHHLAFDALLILVALHVAAIFLYWAVKRSNLVGPMLTGRAALEPHVREPRMSGLVLASILAALSAAAVWALVTCAPALAWS
ncbi:MAG TPA: cytochrome b/b6 domain-containing protein [Allosphingosinicella sp.]